MSGVTHLAISAAVHSHNVTPFYFHARRSPYTPDNDRYKYKRKSMICWSAISLDIRQPQVAGRPFWQQSNADICTLRTLPRVFWQHMRLEEQLSQKNVCSRKSNDTLILILFKSKWLCLEARKTKWFWPNHVSETFFSRRDEPDWIVGRSTRRTSYTEYGTIIPQMEMT